MNEKTWNILGILLMLAILAVILSWWWHDEVRVKWVEMGPTIFISESGEWLHGKENIKDGLTIIGCTWITEPNEAWYTRHMLICPQCNIKCPNPWYYDMLESDSEGYKCAACGCPVTADWKVAIYDMSGGLLVR